MRCYYEVDLMYPLELWEGGDTDQDLYGVVGRVSDSSGAGFGSRDHQWDFDSLTEAQKASDAIRGFFSAMGVKETCETADVEVGFCCHITHCHWDDEWQGLDSEVMEKLMYPEEDCDV